MAAITSNGTGGGVWSAGASWTGAAVPAEGDTVIIQNGDTITIDQNITVGADTATAAIDVASGGKLEVPSTVAADYTLTCKGDLKNSSGGTLEIGTVANPIPAARIFTIKLNYSTTLAEGEFGLKNYGDMVIQGDPARITVTKCMLNADAAADATGLTSGVLTGWKDNDDIAIASTTRTWTEAENGKMNGAAVGTVLTVDGFGGAAGGVANAHSGTSPTQAEIINLTRNVKITSYNTTYRGYVCCYSGSTSDVDYVEFYMIGYNATYKHGIEIRTTAAAATNFAYCSVWGNAASNYPFYIFTAQNIVIDNCVIYNTDEEFYVYGGANNSVTNTIILKITDYGFYLRLGSSLTFNNNTVSSTSDYPIYVKDVVSFTSFNDTIVHSCAQYVYFYIITSENFIISNLKIYRSNSWGMYLRTAFDFTFNDLTLFGNNNYNMYISSSGPLTFDNLQSSGDSSFATAYGLYLNNVSNILIEDSAIGINSGIFTLHTSSDIYTSYYNAAILKNTFLRSANNVSNIQNTPVGSHVQCEDFNQVQYADKAWYKYGVVERDSTTKKTNTYATRFDYLWAATDWLEYEVEIPVKDGESVVVSAWLRKNASYTSANRPKIKLSGMGITATEDQMSNVTDTWEKVTVSGTPTRTGLAKLTIMTYLTNVGASAWVDFDATGVTQPVLNTLTGDFWADGHFSTILFDTGTITPAEFWKTLTSSIDETGSFANLLKDNLDAAISDIASDVWDEILTGATHNIPTSAGRRVREIGAYSIHSGTAQAGNSHSITLAATADANDGIYNRNLIVLVDNAGVGQTRTIVDYDGTTKVVVVDRDWRVSPDATTVYQITPDDTPLTVDHGVALGGTNRTITIRAYAASVDDAYLCNIVTIIAGKGRGQARLVGSYDGTTKIVTICGDDWVDIPDTTSVYVMMPYGVACAACMGDEALGQLSDAVWDEDLTGHTTSKTAGWFVQKIKAIADAILAMVT